MPDRYLEFVQETARKFGKEFFIDSGEGTELGTPGNDWYVENLSGWLVDSADVDVFQAVMVTGGKKALYARFERAYCFVRWTRINNPAPDSAPVMVRFEMTHRGA